MVTISEATRDEIELTISLGDALTLIFVFGPGYLTAPGFAELEAHFGVDAVVHHRLDRDGPNIAETIAGAGSDRPLVLVGGLERMAGPRKDLLESLNLLRDTLSERPAAVIVWVPLELADLFRQLCVDLFHWRTLTVFVERPPGDNDRRRLHAYLVELANTPLWDARGRSRPVVTARERYVLVGDDARPTAADAWLDGVSRGLLLGLPGFGKTTVLRRYAARQASRVLDGDATEIPILIDARSLDPKEGLFDRSSSLLGGLQAPRVVVLVDGLDELSSYRRVREMQGLSNRFDASRLRVVVASRDLPELSTWTGWQHARVGPLDVKVITTWLEYFGANANAVELAIAETGLEELLRDPLTLQLFNLAIERTRSPILGPTAIIDAIVEVRLGQWDEQRGVQRGVSMSREVAAEFLSALAARMMADGIETASETLARQIAQPSRSRADELLEFTTERTNLLESEADGYRFTHSLFRDYFAGRWLAARDLAPEQLTSYAREPSWQPAMVHALALMPPRKLELSFEQLWTLDWSVRRLALEGALQQPSRSLRATIIERASEDVELARGAKDQSELLSEIERLLDRAEARGERPGRSRQPTSRGS